MEGSPTTKLVNQNGEVFFEFGVVSGVIFPLKGLQRLFNGLFNTPPCSFGVGKEAVEPRNDVRRNEVKKLLVIFNSFLSPFQGLEIISLLNKC
jgi:hypothetical protein